MRGPSHPGSLFFFLIVRRRPISTLFPYTTLFRSRMCGRNIGAIFSGPRPCLCPPSPVGSTLRPTAAPYGSRSEEHTSELQSLTNLVCRLLLEKKNTHMTRHKLPLLHQIKMRPPRG